MIVSLATKPIHPPGLLVRQETEQPSRIKNRACQGVGEPSGRDNHHLAQMIG